MDFSLTEEQEEIRALTARILGDFSTPDRLTEVGASTDRVDRRLWRELGSAGLLSLALPEARGGAGLGFLAAAIVLEEVGRVAAAVPYDSSIVFAAIPIARFGSDSLQDRWLTPLGEGGSFLTAALCEAGTDPLRPMTSAERDGRTWRLDGCKSYVPAATIADAVVVPAATDDGGVGLFVVERANPGVQVREQEATDGRAEAEVTLVDALVDQEDVLVVGPDARSALRWIVERAQTAICLQIAGSCQSALRLTSQYTSQRKQFDKAIATFQAVGQRAADAYIDAEAVRLTAWQAAWRLSEELPASVEVAVAKFWADEGAQRVVHAAQHLHGGMGVDRDYPLHRHFLLVKHLALVLGGGTTSLLRLGEILAAEPA